MKTTAEILIAARALIADENNWTQGAFERVFNGKRCFCAHGAIMEACDNNTLHPRFYRASVLLASAAVGHRGSEEPEGTIWQFNDEHSHSAVVAAFDKAIAAASLNNPDGRSP